MLMIERKNNWLHVALNRPEIRNAFNEQLISELKKLFKLEAKNKKLKGCSFTGQGSVFCAGADLEWMKSMVNFSKKQNQKDAQNLFEMFQAMWDFPNPIVTKVQGAAFGGALGLIACSDYVIAQPQTQFCFSEVKLGIIPAVISGFVLSKTSVGFAQPYMMSGKAFDASVAQQMGLVHEVHADLQGFDSEKVFEAAGAQATVLTKKLVRHVQGKGTESRK
jgi:methylglutaconyl-CoA hydratase